MEAETEYNFFNNNMHLKLFDDHKIVFIVMHLLAYTIFCFFGAKLNIKYMHCKQFVT